MTMACAVHGAPCRWDCDTEQWAVISTTEEERRRERIVAGLKARQRYADIGQQEGCSAATVARVAKAEGLARGRGTHRTPRGPESLAPEAARELHRAGWSQADIARVLHLSRQRVSSLVAGYSPPPSP